MRRPDCFTGPGFCLNVPLSCSFDNSECALATLSAKGSKLSLDGKLQLKASVKGVTDGTGTLMTTGPAVTATDNLVLKVVVSTCPVDTGSPPICDDPTDVYVKLVLTKKGKGKLKVDLGPVLALPPGSPFAVLGAALVVPGGNPGDCAGDNSASAITTRLNDATCSSGIVRGVAGMVRQ